MRRVSGLEGQFSDRSVAHAKASGRALQSQPPNDFPDRFTYQRMEHPVKVKTREAHMVRKIA